jgi:hypothetical protein
MDSTIALIALGQERKEMKIESLLMAKEAEVFGLIKSEMGEGIEGNNYLWYPSDSPLLFQAHIDTVRDEKKELKINIGTHVITGNGVLGADDRAGVCIAMWIHSYCKKHKLPMPQFLFTNKEETGGIGMKQFLACDPEFGELKLAIALDRRGASEYVTYNVLSDEVHEYISQFGFVEEYGTFSDIEYFSDHTKIPSVNVSVGYYHQHTTHEQLNIDEMRLTLRRCIFIIAEPIEALYPVKEKVYKQGQQGYQYPLDYGWDYYDKRYDRKEDTYDLCEWCNYEAATTTADWYGQKIYVCQYCAEIIIEELEDEKQERRAYA